MIFDSHTHLFGPGMCRGPTEAAIKRAWGPDMEADDDAAAQSDGDGYERNDEDASD